MKSTYDQTWKLHLKNGHIIQIFDVANYRMAFVKPKTQHSTIHYHYRLIVFEKDKNEAILSLNLEENPDFGTVFLGAHVAEGHETLKQTSLEMTEKEFIVWAMKTAFGYLHLDETVVPNPLSALHVGDAKKKELTVVKILRQFITSGSSIMALLTVGCILYSFASFLAGVQVGYRLIVPVMILIFLPSTLLIMRNALKSTRIEHLIFENDNYKYHFTTGFVSAFIYFIFAFKSSEHLETLLFFEFILIWIITIVACHTSDESK